MESTPSRHLVTRDLQDLGRHPEDREAIEQRLYARIYDELRSMAGGLMRHETPGRTLQPTDLVHEAYLKLVDEGGVSWQGRAHFFGSAARAMRRILVDHARRRHAGKRGGDWERVTLEDDVAAGRSDEVDLVAMDVALQRLAELDPRMVTVAELRVFGGLKLNEIATGLGVSERTVDGDWAKAKRWLKAELGAT